VIRHPRRLRGLRRRTGWIGSAALVAIAALALPATALAQPVSPYVFFGYRMGDEGRLADWSELREYFARVDEASDRVRLVELGPSTEGRQLVAAIISAPETLARLDEIQATNRLLADPRQIADEEAPALIAGHKAVVAIGASIHATEIGATQMSADLLHELATSDDPHVREVLDNLVVILMPSLNPDGHDMVVDWYRTHRGTPFEGGPLPWLYQKYAGHDINRDAFMLNLEESRTLARFFYGRWHPHVFLAMHQMGQRGPRFFVPPSYDPIDPNYDPLIWRTAALLGQAMALRMEQDGHAGVISHAMYDYYWPGYEDSAPLGHNTVCLLTEVASAALASPVEIAPDDLTGTPRGLPRYAPQINFPNPWPGGTWRLRDIVDYEMSAVRGLLAAAARYRAEIVGNFYAMGRRAVARGEDQAPYAFVIDAGQHDPLAATTLVNLLVDGGVEVWEASEPFRVGEESHAAGTWIVPMAQPFRAYAKTLLERQDYPVRRLAENAPPERPYDVAGWTLPYQMGVTVATIATPFEMPVSSRVERATIPGAAILGDRRPRFYLVDAPGSWGTRVLNALLAADVEMSWTRASLKIGGRTWPAGTLVARHSSRTRRTLETLAKTMGLRATGVRAQLPDNLQPLFRARVGLYKPWRASIDEGWTRFLLERFDFPYESLAPDQVRAGDLRTRFDVIVLPDEAPDRLMTGHEPGTVPSQYEGGLGSEGLAALRAFVEAGGSLVCLDSSCGVVIDALDLAVKDLAAGDDPPFYAPGSILRVTLDENAPLAFGLPPTVGAFFANSAAFDASGASPTTVGRYVEGDLLMSGWLEGAEALAGRAAVLDGPAGAGRVVLLGFRAQHRAQSYGTFRLLFNALYRHAPLPAARRGR
jgi:hypothetical protein